MTSLRVVAPRVALVLVSLVAPGQLGAQDQFPSKPPAPDAPRNFSLPARREFTLDNGMQVTLAPYGSSPKVDVELVVYAGRVNESRTQTWLSDVTGAMLLEGTATRSARAIAQDAAQLGGAISVNTGAVGTYISLDALSEGAPKAIALIADVVQNPTFPEVSLDRIKDDKLRDIAIEKSTPQGTAMAAFRAAYYGDHPYGRWFPDEQQFSALTTDNVTAFWRDNFGAARAHIYVVGRFDAVAAENAIRASFGAWRHGNVPVFAVPHPVTQRIIHLIDRPGAVQSTIYLALPVPDPSQPDYLPLTVTNALLGGSFASRITANIREQKGYTYSPFGTISARYHDAYWLEGADVTTNVTGAAIGEILKEVERLQTETPSDSEVAAIENYVAGTFVLQNSTRAGIINQLEFGDLHGLGDDYLTSYVARVHAVTPERIRDLTAHYIRTSDMLIVVVGDKAKILDQLKPIADVVSP